MYADDMVLFSGSIEGLQSFLNELSNYCDAYRSYPTKTGDQFTYLGIMLSLYKKFTKAGKQLSEQGKKVLFGLQKYKKYVTLSVYLIIFS